MARTMIIGDVHGRWAFLRELIEKHCADVIFQVGDFGYFPNMNGRRIVGEGIFDTD